MGSIHPNPEKLQAFLAGMADDTPITMLNLLKYREEAAYPDDFDAEPCSGVEAYQTYSAAAGQHVAAIGGKLLWMGAVQASLIAPEGEEWDAALLVQYPSAQALAQMLASPDYQQITVHRTAALADSRLIATVGRMS